MISTEIVHDVLVTEQDFVAVQGMRAARADAKHAYLLIGLLMCSLCGRRMEGAWSNGCAAYRCRHGHSSAAKPSRDRVRHAFVKESHLLARLPLLHARLDPAGARAAKSSKTSATKKTTARRPEEVIDYLRAHALTLAYCHETRTLETKAEQPVRVKL